MVQTVFDVTDTPAGWLDVTDPPTEGLQRPYGQYTVCTYDMQFDPMWKEGAKVGGLRTAVESALLLVPMLEASCPEARLDIQRDLKKTKPAS